MECGGWVSMEWGWGRGGISRFHCFPTVLPVFSFLPPVDSALQFSTGCLGESLQSSAREEKTPPYSLLVWCKGMFGLRFGSGGGQKQQTLEMSMWRFHSYQRADAFTLKFKCIGIFFLHCFD